MLLLGKHGGGHPTWRRIGMPNSRSSFCLADLEGSNRGEQPNMVQIALREI
jgi:hypothetical protein